MAGPWFGLPDVQHSFPAISYLRGSKTAKMKTLKWIGGILLVLILLIYFVGLPALKEQTKKNSPEKTARYEQDGLTLSVTFSSPSKKGRTIFGELVPFGKVWRTGANEPTRFRTATALVVGGQTLPAGEYSLWTIPGQTQWTVIFNREIPDWGATLLSGGKEATRNPESDVLQINVPVENLPQVVEDFDIRFVSPDAGNTVFLEFRWDTTRVRVPLNS